MAFRGMKEILDALHDRYVAGDELSGAAGAYIIAIHKAWVQDQIRIDAIKGVCNSKVVDLEGGGHMLAVHEIDGEDRSAEAAAVGAAAASVAIGEFERAQRQGGKKN